MVIERDVDVDGGFSGGGGGRYDVGGKICLMIG